MGWVPSLVLIAAVVAILAFAEVTQRVLWRIRSRPYSAAALVHFLLGLWFACSFAVVLAVAMSTLQLPWHVVPEPFRLIVILFIPFAVVFPWGRRAWTYRKLAKR